MQKDKVDSSNEGTGTGNLSLETAVLFCAGVSPANEGVW